MQIRSIFSIVSLVTVLMVTSSCTKVEGPGGSSSITGKLYALVHDGAGNLINQYDLLNHDVFLIYGDNEEETYFDDDIETSYDGTFRFDYLEKGNYRLFVYEKCTTCPSGKNVLMFDVEIKDKKSTVDLGTINVEK